MTQGILNNPLLHHPWAIIINHRCFGDGGGAMRSIVLVGLLTLLIGVAQAQDVGEVQSKAEFVVGSAGECRFNFAITYHNKTITGAVPRALAQCLRRPTRRWGTTTRQRLRLGNAMG